MGSKDPTRSSGWGGGWSPPPQADKKPLVIDETPKEQAEARTESPKHGGGWHNPELED